MMKKLVPVAFAALAALAPGLAVAECGDVRHDTVSTCQPGQVWDAGAERCTTPVQS